MHQSSVFCNSLLKVPVDPVSKMPKTSYERNENLYLESQCSLDSSTSYSASDTDVDAEKLKDFYRSIPDYNEINHLSEKEFYCTLKTLRERKKIMFNFTITDIDNNCGFLIEKSKDRTERKSHLDRNLRSRKKSMSSETKENKYCVVNQPHKVPSNKKTGIIKEPKSDLKDKIEDKILSVKGISKTERPKRNHSACSITWHDDKKEFRKEVDEKFDKFFEKDSYDVDDKTFRTQSMPSSPLRNRRSASISPKSRENITIPKPFKMTRRDEDNKIVNELRGLQKSFSEDMLNQKRERKQFKARPVPIESRIPLYDKILEDQAMRRAITKINSEAELRAQMKPFSFTKREECGKGICDRAANALPKAKKKKRFKARPVPKNLFSNYFYDRLNEENFFRSMNRRIRAEEMLKNSSYPGLMTTRDQSRISTPAAHSDLPTDPSPAALSGSTINKYRSTSPTKQFKKRVKQLKDDFITTSPQPFHFNTAARANQKMKEISKKMSQDIKTSESRDNLDTVDRGKVYSALDLREKEGRSNLAALLRAEAVKKKFEMEADKRLYDQLRRIEAKHRNRLLRSKPAWHLVKNNHEAEIAMRLQTRRDEERMRREEFLHEMELMYGRVQKQPMLFERFYAPRSGVESIDYARLSPRKKSNKSRNGKRTAKHHLLNKSVSPDSNEESSKHLYRLYDSDGGATES
ncbi:protein FAM161A [Aricia agestis]|uniref:protein FAM161A n=1 Tax=Aricia agestis TaxID=91739 RepID=UPI001C208D28|nr:protein FAM161A [Aricia agestis]